MLNSKIEHHHEVVSVDELGIELRQRYAETLASQTNPPRRFDLFSDLASVGIDCPNKLFVGLIFSLESGTAPGRKLHLWIDTLDPVDQYPHTTAEDALGTFLWDRGKYEIHTPRLTYLIVHGLNKQCLVVDDLASKRLVDTMSRVTHDNHDREELEAICTMLRAYGIDRVIGKVLTSSDRYRPQASYYGSEAVVLIDSNLFGQIREEKNYTALAARRGMSQTEFLRFHLRARTAWQPDSAQPVCYEMLADQVLDERTDSQWQNLEQI